MYRPRPTAQDASKHRHNMFMWPSVARDEAKEQPSDEDVERPERREKRDIGDLPPSDDRPASIILSRQWSVQTWNGFALLGHRGSTFLPSPSEPSRTAATA
jgi:hypothetical protein